MLIIYLGSLTITPLKRKTFFWRSSLEFIHTIWFTLKNFSFEIYFWLNNHWLLIFLFKLIGSVFIYSDNLAWVGHNVSVGFIQNGHIYLLPLQFWGRSYWRLRLGFSNFWHQFIVVIDLKSLSSSYIKTSFVGCWPLFCIDWIIIH